MSPVNKHTHDFLRFFNVSLQELPHLEDLLFVGNPLYDGCELEAWRSEAGRRLPNLKKLDGETVLRGDEPPLTVADMQVCKLFIYNTISLQIYFFKHTIIIIKKSVLFQPDGGDGVETLVSAETND